MDNDGWHLRLSMASVPLTAIISVIRPTIDYGGNFLTFLFSLDLYLSSLVLVLSVTNRTRLVVRSWLLLMTITAARLFTHSIFS